MPIELRTSADVADDLVDWLASDEVQDELAPILAAINAALDNGHTITPVRQRTMEHDATKYPKLTILVFPGPSVTKQVTRDGIDREYEVSICIACRVFQRATNAQCDPLEALGEAITELAFNVDLGDETISRAEYSGPNEELLKQGMFLAWVSIFAGPDDDD